jgi:NADH:ubiquinone oxidoreductase subunit E
VDVQTERVNAFVRKHQNQKKALIAILQDIQAEYNYLPREALQQVSRSVGVPLIDVVGVATFYRAFSLKPRGRHIVTVCLGTACHVRGGPRILEEFERRLGLKAGDTSPDGRFTLETVACLGCCAIGPVVVVDGDYHAQTSTRKVEGILRQYMAAKSKARRA